MPSASTARLGEGLVSARHADHHLIASRRYPALASRDQAPQLPAGYATMLLALVPPLWRKVMDPRVPRPETARRVASFN